MRTSSHLIRRSGMSFIEVLMAIAVLSLGIIPLIYTLTGTAKKTKLTIYQVQATSHAANLLEALRSLGYPGLRAMPSAMVQPRGGTNQWVPFSASMNLEMEDIQDDGRGDMSVFEDWKTTFFGEPSVVPRLETQFTRYFYLYRTEDQPYVTLIVRVEWPARGTTASGSNTIINRKVELRSLVADPYRGGEG